MNLQELKNIIDAISLRSSIKLEDLEVCIPNNKGGMMGSTPATAVRSANKGFDWNNSKFFIWSEVEMIEQPKYLGDVIFHNK